MTTNESNEKTFVSKFATWTTKLNRGGLKTPSDKFFLLVCEFESIYRTCVDLNSLSSLSLDRPTLVEKIMDSFMVNYYWDVLCTSSTYKDFILEKCVVLFLTVRGNSTARHIKLLLEERRLATNK